MAPTSPRLLTSSVHEGIVQAIRAGASELDASRIVNVNLRTFERWMKTARDLEAISRENDTDEHAEPDSAEWRLRRDIENAKSSGIVEALAIVRKAARGYDVRRTKTVRTVSKDGKVTETTETVESHEFAWTAAAWLCERLRPDEFGRKTRHEVSGPQGAPIPLEVNVDEQVASLLDELLSREARLSGDPDTELAELVAAGDDPE